MLINKSDLDYHDLVVFQIDFSNFYTDHDEVENAFSACSAAIEILPRINNDAYLNDLKKDIRHRILASGFFHNEKGIEYLDQEKSFYAEAEKCFKTAIEWLEKFKNHPELSLDQSDNYQADLKNYLFNLIEAYFYQVKYKDVIETSQRLIFLEKKNLTKHLVTIKYWPTSIVILPLHTLKAIPMNI